MANNKENTNERTLIGKVVSVIDANSIRVEVETKKAHPLYKKTVKVTQNTNGTQRRGPRG